MLRMYVYIYLLSMIGYIFLFLYGVHARYKHVLNYYLLFPPPFSRDLYLRFLHKYICSTSIENSITFNYRYIIHLQFVNIAPSLCGGTCPRRRSLGFPRPWNLEARHVGDFRRRPRKRYGGHFALSVFACVRVWCYDRRSPAPRILAETRIVFTREGHRR